MPHEETQTGKKRPRSARLRSDQIFAALTDTDTGADQAFGIVRDVSTTGIAMVTPQPPSDGSHVTARISVGEQLFSLRMRVARIAPHPSGQSLVGLEFEPTNKETRKDFLRTFLVEGRLQED